MRKKTIYPCRDCYDRKAGCHGNCERYIKHKMATKAKKEAVKVERDAAIMQDRYKKEKGARLTR